LIIAKYYSVSNLLLLGIAAVVTCIYYAVIVYRDPLLQDEIFTIIWAKMPR
jgi:hypothetical protein